MMSYTSAWPCLWSSAGMLMRRPSPWTRAGVLGERVDAEARQCGDRERGVERDELLGVAALLVRHEVVHQRMDLLVVQRRDVDAAHVAVDADHRRQACRQMQVRCLVLDRERQQFGDIHACSPGAATGMNNPCAAV